MNREEAIRKVEGCLTDYFPIEDCGKVLEQTIYLVSIIKRSLI